ncbi:GPO family capsid scaffolding protein [Delftia sp. WSY_7]|uniref:GPO family capsid scaffolding protein n=1 Tax=Delftia sp. WSY_7 TaxID=3367202 RepID=UPI003709DDCB
MSKKFFRVATEGKTVDGREIKREWIEQIANTYSRTKYGARVWVEHLRSVWHDSPFSAQGDVLEVEAREVEDGLLALFASIKPLESLVAMNRQGKKIYSSIEVEPNFQGKGEAYLMGLAVTDSPASIGCEALSFSAKGGKQVFSEFIETELEFSEDEPEAGAARDGVVSKLLAKFKRLSGRQETGEKFAAEMTEAMQEAGNAMEALDGKVSKFGTEQQDLRKKLEEHLEAFAEFREKVEKTDSNPNKRPLNTGGAGYEKADC